MRLTQKIRPYEMIKGSTDVLYRRWVEICQNPLSFQLKKFKENVKQMVREYSALEISDEVKPKVGIVGEILVKYLPATNNYIAEKKWKKKVLK